MVIGWRRSGWDCLLFPKCCLDQIDGSGCSRYPTFSGKADVLLPLTTRRELVRRSLSARSAFRHALRCGCGLCVGFPANLSGVENTRSSRHLSRYHVMPWVFSRRLSDLSSVCSYRLEWTLARVQTIRTDQHLWLGLVPLVARELRLSKSDCVR